MNADDILSAFPPGERTLPTMLQRQARRYGSRPLFVAGDVSWSFAEAPAIAARFAGTLAAAGIRPGDRVALMCGNRAEFMESFLGCAWLGAIAVPLNVAARGPQLAHYLRNSGARLLIIEAELLDALAYIDMQELALERIWLYWRRDTVAADSSRVAVDRRAAARRSDRAVRRRSRANAGDPLHLGHDRPVEGRVLPARAIFLVGSPRHPQSGNPRRRRALHHAAAVSHQRAWERFTRRCCRARRSCAEPRFSASRFWQRLIERRATVTYLLGAMVPILLSREPSPDEQSHTVRCALAPGVPANLHAAFEHRTGIKLIDGYGSTETNFVIGATAAERRAGRMGTVREGFDARVVDARPNDAPPGRARRTCGARGRTARLRHRLFRHARQDRRGVPRRLVSYRRPRGARSRTAIFVSSTA